MIILNYALQIGKKKLIKFFEFIIQFHKSFQKLLCYILIRKILLYGKEKPQEFTKQQVKINKMESNLQIFSSSSQKRLDSPNQSQQTKFKQELIKGIKHPRIRQMILSHKNIDHLLSPFDSFLKVNKQKNITNLRLLQQRKWLKKKGKKYLIDFDDHQRKQMKNYFNSLDLKKTGSIGIDELEEVLISVGLVDSREQVKQLVNSVGQDKCGGIQFSQFLKMILNDEETNEQIVQFFKQIINNKKKNNPGTNPFKNQKQFKGEIINKNTFQFSQKKRISLMNQKQNKTSNLEKSCCQNNKTKQTTPQLNMYHQPIGKQNLTFRISQNHPHPNNLPFGMLVSHIRRKHMLTALGIGQKKINNFTKKISFSNETSQNKTNNKIATSLNKSSKYMREPKFISGQLQNCFSSEQIKKGRSVMNALRKMWDRRQLRQMRQNKLKRQSANSKLI